MVPERGVLFCSIEAGDFLTKSQLPLFHLFHLNKPAMPPSSSWKASSWPLIPTFFSPVVSCRETKDKVVIMALMSKVSGCVLCWVETRNNLNVNSRLAFRQ